MSLAAMKTSLTWVGIDPASYFPYHELKSLNELGQRKVVQKEKYIGFLQRMNSDRILHSFNLINRCG